MHGWRQFLDLLFPRSCLLCRRLVVEERSASLCSHCQEQLVPIDCGCQRCGAPMQKSQGMLMGSGPTVLGTQSKRPIRKARLAGCRFCKDQRWEFGRAWSYTVYDSAGARAVRLMKDAHCESLTQSIGDMLAQWLKADESFNPVAYDAIVPIPQHWLRRLAQRYNQATTLGERLAKALDMSLCETVLRRNRWTQKQGMKTISERRENLVGAFEVPRIESVRYRSFLLIDDVMTSGATLQEAARAFRRAGARQVDAVVFARGVNATKAAARVQSGEPSEARLTFGQNNEESPGTDNKALRRKIH